MAKNLAARRNSSKSVGNKIKHLEMIQNIVNRMASGSTFLKGWTVILVAAVLGFVLKNSQSTYVWLAIIPTLFFWGLDGIYLRQEKLFRALYNKVRILKEENIDFSMDTSDVAKDVKSWFHICFSKTIWPFYLPIMVVIVAAFVWALLKVTCK